MTLNKRERERLLAHCGQLNEDDAVDPRDYFQTNRRTDSNKVLRLCRQVADCLVYVLASEFDDEVLHGLQVLAVYPAPDASRLLVLVQPDPIHQETSSPERLLSTLQMISGRLRTEVANSITRKCAPRLTFQVRWLEHAED